MNYQWLDHAQQTRQLSFSLDKQSLQSQYQNQTDFKPAIAQRYVYVSLMKQAQAINPKHAKVKIVQRGERLEIRVSSRSPEMLEKWKMAMSEKQQQAFNQYLSDNHYTLFTNHTGQSGVIPDHIRYIEESREFLLPVAQAIYDKLETGTDTRDYVNLLLSWIQSIPYDLLESRVGANGSGFFTPVEVLMNNKGDCDSKATLTASLLRSLLPNLSMVMVYLPEHALLAVNLGHRIDEQLIDIRGAPHILIDPTGPALMTLGKISDESSRHIANGSYSFQVIP